MGNGARRRRTEQNTTSAGLPLSKPVFVPDLCFRVSLKACGSAQPRQRAGSSVPEYNRFLVVVWVCFFTLWKSVWSRDLGCSSCSSH